ncbi:MAG: VWA domain-containing protein [Colwellia sp.]|uniref:vWA domain-containing protein n=1 Tax=Colwellia sp. TaxID=56799 RepID=UPI001DAE55B0|nr:VWA domain-containing protein [Colwellia sp.]NQY48289.1 VWA domain-containing protein [Colwellia sp.]
MSAQATNLLTDVSQLTSDFTLNSLSFEAMVNNFHFIRPWWLFAFLALFLVLFLLKKIRYYQSPWQHFLPAHLANALLENSHSQATAVTPSQKRYWLKPVIIGSCIIFALAGPAWQKLPQPVYQLERGAVLIMDMSYSMYATDVKPNRLTRARYKAFDLLKEINEGDIGLIAYAGDAFIISPLTQDIKNIELLLPSLSPDIMPVHGANALAALTLADQTLKNAGHISGDIYWFTDDIDNEEMSDIYDWANDNNHKVNILGVGSKNGAPIKLSSGKLLKDHKGAIVIPKLPKARLAAISQRSQGVYHTMTNDDADIKALTAHLSTSLDDNINSQNSSEQQNSDNSKQALLGDQYQEQGPWLLIIILPLLLSYFRRGSSILAITWLMPLTLVFSLTSFSPTSFAAEAKLNQEPTSSSAETSTNTKTETSSSGAGQFWRDLWQTSDQQGQQHYQQKDYQQAAGQFVDSQWQGSAHYKAGDYEQALQAFKQSDNAQAFYNQGNSLAQLQKIDEAIDAYKKALAKDPNLNDAKDNLAKLEALKKQQEQQEQQSQDGQDSEQQSEGDQQEQKDNQENQQSQDGQKQSQDQSQSDDQPDDQQQNNQQGKEGEQQDKQSQDAKQQEQKEQEAREEQAKQAKAEADEQDKPGDEKSLAQQASDNKAQETEQKHQQLLNKVTDDPYLLLRNKMRLEYQKRRHEGSPQGVTKKW